MKNVLRLNKKCLLALMISMGSMMPACQSGPSAKISKIPYLRSSKDLASLYPKSKEEIQRIKVQAQSEFTNEFNAYLASKESLRSFDEIVTSYDRIVGEFLYHANLLQLVSMVSSDKELSEEASKVSEDLKKTILNSRIEHPELYPLFQSLQEKNLSKDEAYYLRNILEGMRLEGLHLSDDKRAELKIIQNQILELGNAFEKNIREDASFALASLEELKGVQESIVKTLKQTDSGDYYLTCDYPTYFAVIEYCEIEKTRKNVFEAFNNKAYPQNIAVLNKLIENCDHLAKLLGFPSYAHMDLSTKMVKAPERADNFIQELYQNSIAKTHDETQKLIEHTPSILSLDETGKIKPWDAAYLRRYVKSELTSVDPNRIKEYFPQDTTIKGLISIYESFFDLSIKEEPAEGLWDPSLKVLSIDDKRTSFRYGYVVLDLFPREGKYSHACEAGIIPSIQSKDYLTVGHCVVIANFQKPLGDKPALMSLDEVKTFFHEFGHALHQFVGRTPWFGTSGTNVKTDFVELPSQILEEWLSEPSILKGLSSHYITHEPLDDKTINAIVSNKTFSSGNFIGTQCYLSMISLNLYLEGASKDTDAIVSELFHYYRPSTAFDKETHFQASFDHLYNYGPAYYGYLWSRVLALDVFEEIKKVGLLNPTIGRRYLEEILSKGGTEDPEVLLENFLGRKPSQEAFLKSYGLQ